MDEYEDDENKITKVYAITREEWREIKSRQFFFIRLDDKSEHIESDETEYEEKKFFIHL